MRFDQRRSLTMAQQFHCLRGNPVCAGVGRLGSHVLSWSFQVAPTPFSRSYGARIDYRHGASPHVYIDDPDLAVLADGRRLPHVYEQSPTRLCLYLPGSGQWADWMRLDQTVVPWAILWLLYFEQWLVSDQWMGGGQHPVEGPVRKSRRPRRAGVSAGAQAAAA